MVDVTVVEVGEEEAYEISLNASQISSFKDDRMDTCIFHVEEACEDNEKASMEGHYSAEESQSQCSYSPNVENSVDWDRVRVAKVEDIADAIKERGMQNVLAGRIQAFLERMHKECGSVDLEWLRTIPIEEAKSFLSSVRGLGLKSVKCVRLLTLQHLAFPMDTNVG
ncbi:unnamed protein product [Calypogeia fissa]